MNTTSAVTPISENPTQAQQRQTAKDIIAANVTSLIEQLEAGHSDALTGYLDAISRFHNYSFGNILDCTEDADCHLRCRLMGVEKPRTARQCRSQRHSHPCSACWRSPQEGQRSPEGHHQAERACIIGIPQYLRIRYLVDLPELREVSGAPGENIDRLAGFLKSHGTQIIYDQKVAPAIGVSYGGRIAILPGQTKAE